MTLAVFQTLMARLIAEPDWRDTVIAHGARAMRDCDLTDSETQRLVGIARDPGLDVNRTLHKGFRLGKLRAMTPLTCAALGSRRLARELGLFWARRPPSSFYFIPEAIEFCDFLAERLAARALRGAVLRDIVAYERASLELERVSNSAPPVVRVRFHRDPVASIAALLQGQRASGVARCSVMAEGRRGDDGRASWRLLERGDADVMARDPAAN